MRHRLDAVHQRLRERVEQRLHVARRRRLATGVAPHDPADLAHVQRLGERRRGRDGREREEAAELARGRGEELAVGGEDGAAALDRPERRAGDHGVDLVEAELERGDDAEVAAAAAQRPEQVRVLVLARADPLAARQHDLRADEVVDRQAVLAGEVAEAAAEREPADAGGRDDPAGGGEPVLVRGAVDLAPGAPAADAHGPRARVDVDPADRGEVDHEAVVDGAEPGAVVPAAADRDGEVALPRVRQQAGDVVRPRGLGDERRPAVDHGVVDAARELVAGVATLDHDAAEVRERRGRGGGHLATVCAAARGSIGSGAPYRGLRHPISGDAEALRGRRDVAS